MKNLGLLLFLSLCVNTLMAQTINDSLLLYLPFNGNANDASGNGNNGVVHNATLTADRFNTPNSAYDFNGVDSYIEIPASSSLSRIYTSSEVTIAAWINIRNWYQGWNVFAVFEQYDPLTDWGSVLLEANWSSGGILFESGYNVNYIGCNYTWSFNQWHHLAVTYSTAAGEAKFYVDGNLLCTQPYAEVFTPDMSNPFVIGRSLSGPDEYSDGIIDEVRIYNRMLQDTEVTTLPTVTAIHEIGNAQGMIGLYPNPVSGTLACRADQPFANAVLLVKDLAGREVLRRERLSGGTLQVQVGALPSGPYMLQVQDGGRIFFAKFMKE